MDGMFLYKPPKDGEPGEFGTQFKAEDLIDKIILTEITEPVIALKVETFVFTGNKELKDLYMTKVIDVTQNLFNANRHRRNYQTKEKMEFKRFKKESIKNPNKHLDIFEFPHELTIELNGFLGSLKSALDSLAQALNPLLSSSFDAWHKGKDTDGKEKSGLKILNYIKNMPKDLQPKLRPMVVTMERDIDWLSYLVRLRDSPVHHGGMKNVSKLIFEQKTRTTKGQIITHEDGSAEPVSEFMKKTLDRIIYFVKILLMAAIHIRVNGFVVGKLIQGNQTTYFWAPDPNLNKAKPEPKPPLV